MKRTEIICLFLILVMGLATIVGCARNKEVAEEGLPVVPLAEDTAEEVVPAGAIPMPPQEPPATLDKDAAVASASQPSTATTAPAAVKTSSPKVAAAPKPVPVKPPAPKPVAAAPSKNTTPAPQPKPAPTPKPTVSGATVVVGKISVVSHVPDPSEVPYTDCLTMVKYTVEDVVNGSYGEKEVLAAFWGMKAAKLQPAAHFQVGQRHRLVIEPLSKHADLQRAMQADDTNDYTLTPQWVIEYTNP